MGKVSASTTHQHHPEHHRSPRRTRRLGAACSYCPPGFATLPTLSLAHTHNRPNHLRQQSLHPVFQDYTRQIHHRHHVGQPDLFASEHRAATRKTSSDTQGRSSQTTDPCQPAQSHCPASLKTHSCNHITDPPSRCHPGQAVRHTHRPPDTDFFLSTPRHRLTPHNQDLSQQNGSKFSRLATAERIRRRYQHPTTRQPACRRPLPRPLESRT